MALEQSGRRNVEVLYEDGIDKGMVEMACEDVGKVEDKGMAMVVL